MSKLPVQHRPRSFFPDCPSCSKGSRHGRACGRVRQPRHSSRGREKEGNYELRAEIPGVDPAKDVDITVRDGVLTIKAERTEKKESNGRSEFSYGSFIRSVTLPAGADEDAIKASYDKGILTVSVPVTEGARRPRSTSRSSPRTNPIGAVPECPNTPGLSFWTGAAHEQRHSRATS